MECAVEFESYSLTSGFTSPLQEVTFALRPGESMGIVGLAGSGKTMLLHVMSQMIWDAAYEPESIRQSGRCQILGYQVTPRKPTLPTLEVLQARTALVSETSAWLPLSIAENFEMAQAIQGRVPSPYTQLVESLPVSPRHRAKLLALAELLPGQIESPLLQHLAVVRALLKRPALLLLDEPMMRMDPVLVKITENLILTMADQATIVWATNDLYQASRVTDLTLFMRYGRVLECTPTPQFFTNPKTREAESFIAGRDDEV